MKEISFLQLDILLYKKQLKHLNCTMYKVPVYSCVMTLYVLQQYKHIY